MTLLIVTVGREEPAFVSLILLVSLRAMTKAASLYMISKNYDYEYKLAGCSKYP
jgi:hypothetical protein